MTSNGGQIPPGLQLVQALGKLQADAKLSWRELGKRAMFHHTVMYRAGTGRRWPTWQVVEAFFRECNKEIRRRAADPQTATDARVIDIIDLKTLKALWNAGGGGRQRR